MDERKTLHFERELGRALTFLTRSRKKFMGDRLKHLDFTGAMYMIVLYLAQNPGASQDAIANHMYIDKCNVARRTKRLEELGFIRRETNLQDRRENNLYLTPTGEAQIPLIRSCLGEWGRSVSQGLNEEERTTLIALLTKMTGQTPD